MLARRRPLLLAPAVRLRRGDPGAIAAAPASSADDLPGVHDQGFAARQRGGPQRLPPRPALLQRGRDYGSALHNFVDAYKIDCSKTELLISIARANELSGNKADAVHALETYLQRAPNVSPEDKAQIQKRIDNLKAQIEAQAPTPPVLRPSCPRPSSLPRPHPGTVASSPAASRTGAALPRGPLDRDGRRRSRLRRGWRGLDRGHGKYNDRPEGLPQQHVPPA